MNKKISRISLILLSTGGMLGSGWLFSPFYGSQTAGIGVLYAWGITACLTLIIGLCFAKICTALPVVGGIYRFMNLTHHKSVGTLFLILGWLSYVVYLPLEAQAVIQYLGFWWPSLLVKVATQVELSWYGILLATGIIMLITWFNTLVITKVTSLNSWVSLWKIFIPLLVAFIAIQGFGHIDSFLSRGNSINFSFENVLLAVTGSGLAFAFSGFQNGLILSNQVENPHKSLPYSLFVPVLVGFVLYGLLSLSYLVCLNDTNELSLTGTAAPLLALLSFLGLTWLFSLLLLDAVIAPLGTTNVYIAVTSRILYSVGKELFPNTFLTKLNKHGSPALALWVNAAIGIMFLFPFPTWKELMNFLSSVVVFAYLAGPIAVLVMHSKKINIHSPFKLWNMPLMGYMGFVCCTWLIYWSGTENLVYLSITLGFIVLAYFIFNAQQEGFAVLSKNWYIFGYLLSLLLVSFGRSKNLIPFPMDNLFVACIGAIFAQLFTKNSLSFQKLEENFIRINAEIES